MQPRAGERAARYSVGLLILFAVPVFAGTIDLQWDPVAGASGYRIYHGTGSGQYGSMVDVGNTISHTLQNLADCTNHYVAVKAYDVGSVESSAFSNEVSGWPRPTLTAQGTIQAVQGEPLTLAISGANFQAGAEVIVDGSGLPVDIGGNPLLRLDSSSVTSCNEIRVQIEVEATVRGLRAMQVGNFTIGLEVRNPDTVFGARSRSLDVAYGLQRSDINRSDALTLNRVDGQDLVWLVYSHGTIEGDSRYNPDADLDGDGQVDGVDLSYLGADFGQCWTGSTWSSAACP